MAVRVTLWKLATNIDYTTLAEITGIGRSTACEIVNNVSDTITSHLLSRYISIPTEKGQPHKITNESRKKRVSRR